VWTELRALALVGVCVALLWQPAVAAAQAPGATEIVARGRIEPHGRVRAVRGPPGTIVRELNVTEGQRVAAGAVLARLDGYEQATVEAELAGARLRLARAELEQLLAGPKTSVAAAQAALIAAREVELAQARRELARASSLARTSAVSVSQLETRRADVDRADQALRQARHEKAALSEVRPVDEAAARARIAVEAAAVRRAEAILDRALVRAPTDGSILSIQARPGEAADEGLLRLGDLRRLMVIAEVDETRVSQLAAGDAAQVSAPFLPSPLPGRVERVEAEMYRQRRPSSDILVGRDARIVEVEIAVDGTLPPVIGAEVTVRLRPTPPARR